MILSFRSSIPFAVLASFFACAPSPPAVPAPPAAPSPAHSAPIVAAAPPRDDPDELRCGLDDGPVPVGKREGPPDGSLRGAPSSEEAIALSAQDGAFLGIRIMRPPEPPPPPPQLAPPWPGAQWSLGKELRPSSAFRRRADTCATAPVATDVGEHRFTVRFAPDGHAIGIRSHVTAGAASSLLSCFQAALCDTERAGKSASGETATATLSVRMLPPVFSGNATFTTAEDSPGMQKRDGTPTGRKVPRRGPFNQDELRWHGALGAMLRDGTIACALRMPPAEPLGFSVRFPYDKRTKKLSTELAGKTARSDYERELQRCFADVAVERLSPPPAGLVPNGAVTIVVDIGFEPVVPDMPGDR